MSLEDFDFKEGFTVDGKHKIVMLDYPNYKPKFYTDQEMKILDDCRDRMAKIIKEHGKIIKIL